MNSLSIVAKGRSQMNPSNQRKFGVGVSAIIALQYVLATSVAAEITRVDDFVEMSSADRGQLIMDNLNSINRLALESGRQEISDCISDLFDTSESPSGEGFGILVHDLTLVRVMAEDNPEVLDEMPVERILFRIVERECIE